MDPVREKRKGFIRKALAFMQSSLAYPEPSGYQDYLTQLVCNLLEEGNAFFRDGQWEEAVREFKEGLNVSSYAEAEEIQIPKVLLESLYVNRAAAYHSMGKYEEGLSDCDGALGVCAGSRRALYRKALCLRELGKLREAYDCTTQCLLSYPEDKQVKELAQELTVGLGLKTRKPYVSTKVSSDSLVKPAVPLEAVSPGLDSFASPQLPPVTSVVPQPSAFVAVDDLDVIDEDLDNLLDSVSTQEGAVADAFSFPSRTPASTHTLAPVLPAPTPQLPPAFFSSAISQLNSLDSFSEDARATSASALDILDDLSVLAAGAPLPPQTSTGLDTLDSLCNGELEDAAAAAGIDDKFQAELETGGGDLDELLDGINTLEKFSDPISCSRDVPKFSSKSGKGKELEPLDALDSFPSVESSGITSTFANQSTGLDSLSDLSLNGFSEIHPSAPSEAKSKKTLPKKNEGGFNPLSSTHEFLQACSMCFPRRGAGIYSFVHKPDLTHNCKQDILLCRRKGDCPSEWTRVRSPPKVSFNGPYVLCKELLKSKEGVCKFGENCTFAYNQLEIDVWTAERKGTLDRSLLFGKGAGKPDRTSSIVHLLQENKGMFVFLCEECYNNKPRIISTRLKDANGLCSNLDAPHKFEPNKCLAFVVRKHNVNYHKVRPLKVTYHLDMCHQAVRYGCHREDRCIFAHSIIELKIWRIQHSTGVTHEEVVKTSTMLYEKQELNQNKDKGNKLPAAGVGGQPKAAGRGFAGKSFNLKMKFACALCWRGGLISEPDKTLKCCNSKARHMWSKDRRVLLVMSLERSKWVLVRPLPHQKNFPMYYDMCGHILKKKKCTFPGNCTFAHSDEEKEMWMYMKNNDLTDMQQVYDMWLALAAQNRQPEQAAAYQPNPEEKCIIMPTDYAEQMGGFHCRFCGKHSNSQRQWQQHISSEKHKDKLFSCEGEDEALTWSYRFPGVCFQLCQKWEGDCPEGVSCDYAHSPEELQEWIERRDFLRHKLAKAREDMLIMPDEFDFGKYNFLLQD